MLQILLFLMVAVQSEARPRIDLWIPQTHTLEPGAVQVSLDRLATIHKDNNSPALSSTLGTSFGIFEKGPVGVEGGLSWVEPSSDQFTRVIHGHLRVRANDVQKDGWAVAMGVEKLGFVTNKNDINVISLNLQNRLDDKWVIGVGGYNGSSRFLVDENGKEDPRGGFLGLWRQIQQGRGRLALEYQSGRNMMSYAFAGLTLELSEFVHGSAGYGFSNNPNLGKDWFLTRISADF